MNEDSGLKYLQNVLKKYIHENFWVKMIALFMNMWIIHSDTRNRQCPWTLVYQEHWIWDPWIIMI